MAISDLPACTNYIFVIFLPELIASPGSRNFDFEYLYPFWYNSKTFHNKIDHTEPAAEVIGNKILELKETWDKKEIGYKHCLDADLRKVLALLIKYFKTNYPEYYTISGHSYAKMQTALDYINKNFSKNITLEETAELFKENEMIDMTEEYHSKYGDVDPYFEELAHFTDCIINDKEFDISTAEAKKAVNTVHKLLENM